MPQLKEYYHDVDLKANQLFNSRLHNITTAARTALGIGLTTNDKGYMVYDTDLSSPYFWDGVQWNAAGGSGPTPSLQQVVDISNGISNFGGIGNASIQSTNFTSGRTLYLNDNSYPTIRLVDNANASNYLQIDLDTLNIDGVSYNWSSIVNGGLPSQATHAGEWLTTDGTNASWASLPPSGVSAVTATSPLFSSGGATPDITIQQASGSQAGYLSSTDWTTFNGKFNLPSLTAGSVLFSNGTTIAQDNANFFWDDTNNRLGIGTATPAKALDIKSDALINELTVGQGNLTTLTIEWSSANLDVEYYRNGDIIPQVTDPTAWANLTTGAWCYYNNDPATGAIYGKLYNGYAMVDPRGLAPAGWHIPTDTEWLTYQSSIGASAGNKMREVGTLHWLSPNTGATNSSGWTGFGGGNRSSTGTFSGFKSLGTWWSSTEFATTGFFWNYTLNYTNSTLFRTYSTKTTGYSVRLIRDYYTNTAVGINALTSNTSGKSSTAIGYDSLLLQTTGSYNTAIGGVTGVSLKTGSYNTILGANIDVPLSSSSNYVLIGDGQGNVRFKDDGTDTILPRLATGGADQMVTADTNGKLKIQTISSGTVTGVTATAPLTSSLGTAPDISTSMNTNKLIGRSTAGVGVMEEITLGTGLSFSGTTLNASGSSSPLTTKGDLYTYSTADARLGVGTAGQILTPDATEATGLKWVKGKTSDLTNDGDNGYTHFISVEDLPSNLVLYATNVASGISTYTKAVSSLTDPDYNTVAVDIPVGPLTSTTVATYCGGIVSSANIIIGNPGIFTMSTLGSIRRTSGSAEGIFFYEVWKRDAGGTETLIVTSDSTVPISAATYTEFNASALFNNGIFTATDRVVIKFYGLRLAGGSNPSFDFQFGGTAPVRTTLPIPLTVTPLPREILSVSTATTAGSVYGIDYIYFVSGTTTITLPTAVGSVSKYTIKRVGTGVVSVATTSSQTIDGSSSPININVQYVSLDLMSDGANWNII